jgi:hypothetical protein
MKRWMTEVTGLVAGLALVIGGAIAYQAWFGNPEGEGLTGEKVDRYRAPMPDRPQDCTDLTGTALERTRACLADIAPYDLSEDARDTLRDIGESGAILALGPQVGLGLDERTPDSALLDALLQNDGESVAALLRDQGVRGVVVARDLTVALDRDGTVLSRLAQHDHLAWFQLRRVTDRALIYTVRSSSNRIPTPTGSALLAGLRARLEGRRPPPQSWDPSRVELIGSVRLQGHTLVLRHAAGSDLERVLDELARDLSRRWQREVSILGMGDLSDNLHQARLEVHVVLEEAPVEPRSRWAIFDLWEIGIDGMMMRRAEGLKEQKFTYMPGAEAITRSMKSADAFLLHAARTFDWNATRPWEDPEVRLEIIRTAHFMEDELGGGGAVRLVRGMPEVRMADLTDEAIRRMLVEGGEWWLTNMRPDDSINYKYWPSQNRMSTDYNEVRHILATRDLADTWRYRRDDRYLTGARRAMDWLLRYAVRPGDPPHATLPHPPEGSLLFRYPLEAAPGRRPPNQKLGTVAVALLGWVAWAEATGDHSEDENIRAMARFVLHQLEDNGKFDPYYVDPAHPYYGQKNDIVPGEAALALGEVAEYFDEPEWLDFYDKYLDYYEPWFRERAARQIPTGRWPHGTYTNQDRLDLVQFGPWSVMANKQAYRVTGDERAAAFGLEVADWMIDNYQWSGERSAFPDYVGGYYKMPTELPAMQSFCYAEGTAAAYHLAATWKPEVKEKYDRSTREAIRFLGVMQYTPTSAYFASQPELIRGGIKYAMNEQKVRIDYVGHGLSTLSQYLDARAADPAVGLDVDIPEVDYAPGHEALWGDWRIDPSAPPEQLAGRELESWRAIAPRLRFTYTPEALLERGMGRALTVPYEVLEVSPEGRVRMRMDPPGPQEARERVAWVGEDGRLRVEDTGVLQVFLPVEREVVAAVGGDEEEPGGGPEDEGSE